MKKIFNNLTLKATLFTMVFVFFSVIVVNSQIIINNQTTPRNLGNAQTQGGGVQLGFIAALVSQAGGIIRLLPPILMSLAVVFFFIYLIQYLQAKGADGKEADMQKGLKRMGYSLIALFVMASLWGLVAFAGDFLGINSNVQVAAPALPR